MNQATVSPSQYREAHNATTRINGALASLQRIDNQTLNQDADAIAKLADFKQLLTNVYEQNKEIIAKGDEQFDRRPIELINKAAARLTEIPVCIELEQKKLAAKLETRKMKADELSKRFTQAEVDRIIPPIPQSEIDASSAIISGLKAESSAIQAFIADSPRYDIELLKGTHLYPSQAEELV